MTTLARIRALGVVDTGVEWPEVEQMFSRDHIEILGVIDGLEEVWEEIEESRADVLLVACTG